MVRPRSCLIAILISLGCTVSAAAAPGSQFTVSRAGVEDVLAGVCENWGPVHIREGEIVGLEWRVCRLAAGGVISSIPLAATCFVFANGLPACPEAVRPVSSEDAFWARLWIDDGGTARLIEAVYAGGELLLTSVSREILTGFSPERQAFVTLRTVADLSVEDLAPGQSVYVLLDLDGRVRQAKRL